MHTRKLRPLAATIALLVLAVSGVLADEAASKPLPAAAAQLVAIPNARLPAPGLLTGGQPTPEQVEEAARAGYRTLINLRTAGEAGNDAVPGAASKLGLRYVSIPVAGASDLTRDNAAKLDAALREGEREGAVMVYCASGNRVGALLALRTAWYGGAAPPQALQLGLDAGLTRLEPDVRRLLGLPAPN